MTDTTQTESQVTVEKTLVALNSEDLGNFISSPDTLAKFALVPKDDLIANPSYIEIVPFVSLATFNPNDGNLTFVVKQTGEQVDGVDTLKETMIGLNATVTDRSQVTCTTMSDREDGVRVYDMNIRELIETSIEGVRALSKSLLGWDLIERFNMDQDLKNNVRYTFFREEPKEGSTQPLRMALSIPLTITAEQFEEIRATLKEQQTTAVFSELTLNAGHILQSFDVSEVATKTINKMKEQERIDVWSIQIVSQRLLEYFELMRSHITYHDLISAVHRNVAAQRASIEASMAEAVEKQGQVVDQIAENAATTHHAEEQRPDGQSVADQPAGEQPATNQQPG